MHRLFPSQTAELRVDDARNALDAFRSRVLQMRLEMSATVEKYLAGMPLHLQSQARRGSMDRLDDLLSDLTFEEEQELQNDVYEAEDELSEADVIDLRRSAPMVI